LAAPPPKGELRAQIEALAGRQWRHPITGEPVRFGFSTIEPWFYRALKERRDPVGVLRRKLRTDAGQQPAMSDAVRRVVLAQYAAHKSWSVQLHHDNLVALGQTRDDLQPLPCYDTLRRFMKANGLDKRRRVTSRQTAGADRAEAPLFEREVRSYEAAYVNCLWHWDCHHGSRKVLTARGEWRTPILFGVLDDRSRLACHLQWYLAETAEITAHGLSQAFQKRGLPRSGLSDNGAAMTAAEITEGLSRLGILHQTTLPYSPYQNAKQEAFWGPVEGRLIAMLEDVPDLTLAVLNEATQAWVEYEYNRKVHSEIGEAPITRFLAGPEVTRPSPDSDTLRLAFTRTDHRMQRNRSPHAAQERRRRRHRGAPLRDSKPLPPSLPHRGPLRRLGSRPRPPRRRTDRQRAVPALSPGQDRERQRPAPFARSDLARAHRRQAGDRHRAAARPADRPAGRHRTAAALSPQGRARRRHVNKKLLALYGLKWNPFAPDVPVEALHATRRIESFCWRVQQLVGEGGFALITGAPGAGKSVTLRILAERLSQQRDVKIGLCSRPQANLADFYREMGDLFGVELRPHNRWAGAKVLRQRWQTHIDASLARPVLVVDEAQEMLSTVLSELRLLCSTRLDSHILLTVVLAGDGRLLERLRSDEFLPLASRMRVRLAIERATPDELQECLRQALHKAGAVKLMTPELIATLCDHAQGNLRALMNMAGELLVYAAEREARQIDEKLFLETCAAPPAADAKAASGRRR
jgi:type II secretory pathway predicted ATPase ExeA/transposase InsO family protein